MDNKPPFILAFIDLYRKYPCLWKVKDEEYGNKRARDEAYGVLLEFYKKTIPWATVDTVKKKINNLRCAFRKELKKVKQSKSVSSADDAYTPSLWYYELLLFTADQEESKETVFSDEQIFDNQEDTSLYNQPSFQPSMPSPTSAADYCVVAEMSDSVSSIPSTTLIKTRKSNNGLKRKQYIDSALNDNDEFDGIGINVACKLRRMDEEQRMYAELLIHKLLLHGLKGRLREETDFTTLNFARPELPVKVSLSWNGEETDEDRKERY